MTEHDIVAVVQGLVTEAKAGNTAAARELLPRTLGKPEAFDFMERLEALEERLGEAIVRRVG